MAPVDRDALPYRPCVGLMLINHDGRVFTGRRIDTQVEAWQMPQGGIDAGEDPETALFREAREEIGTDRFEIMRASRDWYHYDLPDSLLGKVWKGHYRGQRMIWYATRFLGSDVDINIETEHPEFAEWRWTPLHKLPAMIVPFKRPLYSALVAEFGDLV